MNLDDLTIENTIYLLIGRLLDISILREDDQVFTIDESQDDFYESMIFHPKLTKPSLQELEDDLAKYKQEVIREAQAQAEELARIKDIKDRWSAMTDIRAVFDGTNPALELNRIIEEDDQNALSNLESAYSDYKSQQINDAKRATRQMHGKICRQMCQDVLDIVTGWNFERSLTDVQKNTMQELYAPIMNALIHNRVGEVRRLIVAIDPDDIITTQVMKDELLEVLDFSVFAQ